MESRSGKNKGQVSSVTSCGKKNTILPPALLFPHPVVYLVLQGFRLSDSMPYHSGVVAKSYTEGMCWIAIISQGPRFISPLLWSVYCPFQCLRL